MNIVLYNSAVAYYICEYVVFYFNQDSGFASIIIQIFKLVTI